MFHSKNWLMKVQFQFEIIKSLVSSLLPIPFCSRPRVHIFFLISHWKTALGFHCYGVGILLCSVLGKRRRKHKYERDWKLNGKHGILVFVHRFLLHHFRYSFVMYVKRREAEWQNNSNNNNNNNQKAHLQSHVKNPIRISRCTKFRQVWHCEWKCRSFMTISFSLLE